MKAETGARSFKGNALALTSILEKLVENAAKFTETGAVWIGYDYDPDERRIEIAISDDGAGIPREKLERIFDAFAVGDASATRQWEGTGLGLAICKRYLDALGGEIAVRSAEGEGSEFRVKFPSTLVIDQSRHSAKPAANTKKEPEAMPSVQALIVEDSTDNGLVLKEFLKRLNINATLVNDGQEAVEICNQQRFDIIFMDIHMPFLNGVQSLKMIRMEYGRNKGTPIIAVTADQSTDLKREGEAIGFDGWITKPLNVATLKSAIAQTEILANKHTA